MIIWRLTVTVVYLGTTLRRLERDGLLTRDVYAEAPPRVECELTPLGKRFMQPVRAFVEWLQVNWPAIRAARDKFDRRSRSREASSAGLTAFINRS